MITCNNFICQNKLSTYLCSYVCSIFCCILDFSESSLLTSTSICEMRESRLDPQQYQGVTGILQSKTCSLPEVLIWTERNTTKEPNGIPKLPSFRFDLSLSKKHHADTSHMAVKSCALLYQLHYICSEEKNIQTLPFIATSHLQLQQKHLQSAHLKAI